MTQAERPATIYDVAARAGVSKSLVSLVLQRSPRVSDQRREAVLRAMAELHYRPSVAAVSLAGTRSRTIGVMLDDFRNQWFVDVLTGLRTALDGHGNRLVVADSYLNTGLDTTPLEGFLSMRVEGIVIAGEPDDDLVAPVGTPVVVAGGRLALAGTDAVSNDDRAGAILATEHLLALGHRHLGFIGGKSVATDERQAGFASATTARGATDAAGVTTILPAVQTEELGAAAMARMLDEHPEVTAVFAANDVMALGALSTLAERGLRVPDDMSLVGYDDSPMAGVRYVDLTSVDARGDEIGRIAGERLLERIADPTLAPRQDLVEPRLVVRRSTGAPRP